MKNKLANVKPMIKVVTDESEKVTEYTYFVGFTGSSDIDEILKDIDYDFETKIRLPENVLGIDIKDCFEWYKTENRPWTGWSNYYCPKGINVKTGKEEQVIVYVIFINYEKIFKFAKMKNVPAISFLMNILSHEVRHMSDAHEIAVNYGLPESIIESPAQWTGKMMEALTEHVIKYFLEIKKALH